jgi:hypothetical protein
MRRFLAPAALAAVLLCLALRPRAAETAPSNLPTPPPSPPPEAVGPAAEPPPPAPAAVVVHRVYFRPEDPGEPEDEEPALATLRLLLRSQNPDGSWGDGVVSCEGHLLGPVGLSGLALNAFLVMGYSQLSKDRYGGRVTGDAVKAAQRFLAGRLGADGLFEGSLDAPYEQAVGALALSESYGMTGSTLLREPAQRALDGLWSLQRADGSWGTDAQTAWAAQALESARVSELWDDPTATERLRGHYERREARGPDVDAAYFRLFVSKDRDASLAAAADWIAAQPVERDPDRFGVSYRRAAVLKSARSTTQDAWKAWSEAQRAAYRDTKTAAGAWPGGSASHRVLRNALGTLAESLHYRYTNVYGSK